MLQSLRNTKGTLQEHEGEAEETEDLITGNWRAWQLQISRCLLLNLCRSIMRQVVGLACYYLFNMPFFGLLLIPLCILELHFHRGRDLPLGMGIHWLLCTWDNKACRLPSQLVERHKHSLLDAEMPTEPLLLGQNHGPCWIDLKEEIPLISINQTFCGTAASVGRNRITCVV